MKCIVVDENVEVVELIKSYIDKIDFLELIAVCKNGFEALNLIEKEEVHLVFTEVEMSSLTGIDLVNSTKNKDVQFVFATSYTHY